MNPLIVQVTKNQGTDVPRSPEFGPRDVQSEARHLVSDAGLLWLPSL